MRLFNYSLTNSTTNFFLRVANRMFTFCCVITMSLVIAGITPANIAYAEGNVTLAVEVTPVVTPYHMPVEYRVIAEGPSSLELQLDRLPSSLSGLEIEYLGQSIDELRSGRYRITQRYLIDPMKIATYQLPPATVKWGDSQSMRLPGVLFKARDLTEEEREHLSTMAPVIEPDTLVPERSTTWMWVSGIVALVLLVAMFYGLYSRRNIPEIIRPTLPAWEIALHRLEDLNQRQLPASGRYEQYYVDLSAILRYYIEDRFQVQAPELTTQEFLEIAGKNNILDIDYHDKIANFLKQSDRVKFARHQPSTEEMALNFEVVESYIKSTIPKETSEEKPDEQEAVT